MASKKVKWIVLFSTIAVGGALVISIPFISSSIFWSDYRSKNSDLYESLKYKIPENLGTKVAESVFAYGTAEDRTSPLVGDNKKFQNAIENTWLFAGGNDFFSNWKNEKHYTGMVGLFAENLRWTLTGRGGDPANPYSSLGRFCFNISKPDQTLKEINDNFDYKVKKVDPQNSVVIVGDEYIKRTDTDKALDEFENDLRFFVSNVLTFRNNTSNLFLMKHWKIPNPNNDVSIDQYNKKVEKFNIRANRILSELTKSQIPRVVLIDNENLFLNLDYYYNEYFDQNGALTRIGNNEVALSILKSLMPFNKIDGTPWTPQNWTNYSKTHLNAKKLTWTNESLKNDLDLFVQTSIDQTNKSIGTITVSFPINSVVDGQKLKWQVRLPKTNLRIEDYSIVQGNKLVLDNISITNTTTIQTTSSTTPVNPNEFVLTVWDSNNLVFNKYNGNFDTTALAPTSKSLKSSVALDFSKAQEKFMARFNDKTKPLTWTFIGDSVDHGASFNQGFDTFPLTVQKSVKSDWKRYDDLFVDATMSGDFTNRAVDPYLLESRITKYAPDVLSVGLGISDGVSANSNGQQTMTNQTQFINNFKTIIETAKKANPNVIVVINAINPTYFSGRQNIPTTYNGYLKTAFGENGALSQYKDFVIFNEEVYTVLHMMLENFGVYKKDQLFLGTDQLHPSGNANLIKARYFLKSLGVDVQNSYLNDYFLQEFSYWTTNVQPITQSKQVNKVVPAINAWNSTSKPLGNTNEVTQITIIYQKQEDQRFYYLTTSIGKDNNTSNNYAINYMEFGNYLVNSYGMSKNSLSVSANYAAKAPEQTLEITKQ